MTFEFDIERTLDAFAHSGMVDLDNDNVTLYGVVCIGADEGPHFSHGGLLTLDPTEAIEAAGRENLKWGDEAGCRYLPAALGLSVPELFALANRTAQSIVSSQEEGDD